MNIIPRNFDSFFDGFFPSVRTDTEEYMGQLVPRVDIEERDKQYLIKADLPGIKREDLSVELSNGLLTIQARHSEESEEKEAGAIIRRERRTGSYTRSFSVGRGLTENDISGEFSDGVLILTVPKVSENEPEMKRIAIN